MNGTGNEWVGQGGISPPVSNKLTMWNEKNKRYTYSSESQTITVLVSNVIKIKNNL